MGMGAKWAIQIIFSIMVIGIIGSNSAFANHDGIVYENGNDSNGDFLPSVTTKVSADDFMLAQDTILTDVHFETFEDNPEWDGTFQYFFFEDNGGQPGDFITGGNGINIIKNGGGVFFSYSIDFDTPFAAEGGIKYWIGFHLNSDFDPGSIFIETNNNVVGAPCFISSSGTFDNWVQCDVNGDGDDILFHLTGHSPNLIGGTLIPIDSTFLLLAGTQMTASWLIPVLVAGAGIVLVLVRKSKNS